MMAIPILMILTYGTEAAERRFCLFEFYAAGTGGGIFCEQPAKKLVVDTACEAFEPIRYSRTDTDETKKRVRAHNAAWDALCKGK